jgi:RNA polymerase sigma-70 factor (ECF subfamily)
MKDREAAWSALLCAALDGDGQAYARFLRAVTPVLRGIVRARARGLAGDQDEDILQEVLMAIHAKRHTWDRTQPILPWLYAVTRHKVIDAFRRRSRVIDLPVEDFAEVLVEETGDPTAPRDLARLIARLDPRSAEILRAMGLRAEPAAEVAQRLDMTEGAVRVALHREMGRLARLVRGEGER